jgi:hypothetical protein
MLVHDGRHSSSTLQTVSLQTHTLEPIVNGFANQLFEPRACCLRPLLSGSKSQSRVLMCMKLALPHSGAINWRQAHRVRRCCMQYCDQIEGVEV